LLERSAAGREELNVRKATKKQLASIADSGGELALAWESVGKKIKVAFCIGEGKVLLAELEPEALKAALAPREEIKGPLLIAHDCKELLRVIPGLPDFDFDTAIAAYLLKPTARAYELEQLAAELDISVVAPEGKPGEQKLSESAALTWLLAAHQRQHLEEQGLIDLFQDVEMPLVRILADMEHAGIRIDLARLGELAHNVADQLEQLAAEIRKLAGRDFNIDSPQQVSVILFDELKLPPGKKTKTGYSTNASVLKGLREEHAIISKIETYRELAKLSNTYLQALPELADNDTWRIHTTFNQMVTATGRLSSSNPNLQNIPVRTSLGEKIRDCFVAPEGHRLVVADYSQVELRIMAHLSGEKKLMDAFRGGEDVHRATAAEVFKVDLDEVTGEERNRAKAVNFGIMYGISAYGLAEQLDIPHEEAADYINTYLERYGQVADFRGEIIDQAEADGYVTTIMGRRRPMPELLSRNEQQRRLGERMAVNTVIQGSAADIIKIAMINCKRSLAAENLTARLVLQVHDELVFEVPEDEVDSVTELARREMVAAFSLDPPLEVDVGNGETWLSAK
jgi:DNA polymerase-1